MRSLGFIKLSVVLVLEGPVFFVSIVGGFLAIDGRCLRVLFLSFTAYSLSLLFVRLFGRFLSAGLRRLGFHKKVCKGGKHRICGAKSNGQFVAIDLVLFSVALPKGCCVEKVGCKEGINAARKSED